MKKNQIKKITTIGILAALSCVFYLYLKFPLPFFPSFLDIQFSNLPVLLAGLMFGPTEAIIIVIIRFLVKFSMSSTMVVGEVADLIIGFFVAVSVSIIYSKIRTKKGGIISLIIGCVVWILGAVIANTFVLIPWYVEVYGLEMVLGLLSVIPGVTADNYLLYYILFAAIPFNTLLSVSVSLITFLVYKRISLIYKDEYNNSSTNYNRLFVGIVIIAIDVIKKPINILVEKIIIIVMIAWNR